MPKEKKRPERLPLAKRWATEEEDPVHIITKDGKKKVLKGGK